MKKFIFSTISIIAFTFLISGAVFAQGDGHTAREEAEGKIVWEKIYFLSSANRSGPWIGKTYFSLIERLVIAITLLADVF